MLPPAAHPSPRCPFPFNDTDVLERTRGAVVETVNVVLPEPFAMVPGLKEQEGGGVTPGAIVQDRVTLPLNPFIEVMVMVDVDDPPAEIVAGESGVAPILKSWAPLAETFSSMARNALVATAKSGFPSPLKSVTTSETPSLVPRL